jgi:Fur family transcriptional regulator, ferric uptake regulator
MSDVTIGEVVEGSGEEWIEHASKALADAGYQKGAARKAVVEFLGRQGCALTALEIESELRRTKQPPGRASIYRTLEQLEQLSLVHRLDLGTGTASYEPAWPGGEHHHHLVCDRCGRVVPFQDQRLERAIMGLSRRSRFDVSGHDVTLHGLCRRCGS